MKIYMERDDKNRIIYFKKNKTLAINPMRIKEFLIQYGGTLKLKHINHPVGVERGIYSERITRPGLALAGFLDRFSADRIQLIGETEYAYLDSLSDTQLLDSLNRMFEYKLPNDNLMNKSDGKVNVLVFSKGVMPKTEIIELANKHNIALIVSELLTEEFARRANEVLERYFAPRINLHATLVDVYGVGVLLTGESGIGKSECALDLVERGHRFVCDDVVFISKLRDGILMGYGGGTLGFHMEIRGAGIIDIEKMFGLKSIRLQKRVEIVVWLDRLQKDKQYVRVGGNIDSWKSNILGVNLPFVEIPIIPGKNITAITEVLAMGVMVAAYKEGGTVGFRRSIMGEVRKKKNTRQYLLSDTE